MPPGSARYWSWLFAADAAREPLVGVFALLAEWRALTDPATEASVAHIKLDWWREEIRRLTRGSPSHPITRYLASLSGARSADLAQLGRPIEAAAAQVAGAPLEHASELQSHADALIGTALWVAAQMTNALADSNGVAACATALAVAEYWARAIAEYRREAHAGRVPFPVEELLAAGIDNEDLAAALPSLRLQTYLNDLRRRAATAYASATLSLSIRDRPHLRHMPVLATLGRRYLHADRSPTSADFRVGDLYNAWNAARRAAASR